MFFWSGGEGGEGEQGGFNLAEYSRRPCGQAWSLAKVQGKGSPAIIKDSLPPLKQENEQVYWERRYVSVCFCVFFLGSIAHLLMILCRQTAELDYRGVTFPTCRYTTRFLAMPSGCINGRGGGSWGDRASGW